ncbi:MAG: DsbA family protein [Rhodospirillales bacterium]|nr:DsbA family protein [Rhodospirillales bacterium]
MKPFSLFRGNFHLLLAALLVVGVTGQALAQSQSKAPAKVLSPVEKQAIEDVVRSFIINNPEVVIEAIQNLRDREQRLARDKATANLVKYQKELFNDPATPVGANPKGDVTIVEFFDYRCGYCKRVFPDVMKVLNEDKNVRYVFKEFPILGPESVTATRAALAAWIVDQNKYMSFHRAMMSAKGGLPESRVLKIAADIGFDVKALKKAMQDPRIDGMIERNYALAKALDINGTPAFIVGDQIVRGAIDLGSLKSLIAQARGS